MEYSEKELIEKRKKAILGFVKEKANWITYIVLALIVYIGIFIRTRNLGGLKDISTGTWTLGPDLDPFLFLRWAKHIVENGSLMVLDTMRYPPLGYNTAGELKMIPYMIAWLYKFLAVFSSEITVTYVAIIFPVVMFALTAIAFFLLVREFFWDNFKDKKLPNLIALIATFFLTVLPAILPRTIAGIPEKESAAFLFMFLALYFFLLAWRFKSTKKYILFAILASVTTACMANTWGAYGYLFLIIGLSVLISFLLGQVSLRRFYVYGLWLFASIIMMMPFSTKFTIKRMLVSTTVGPALLVFGILLIHLIIYRTKIKNYLQNGFFSKIPNQAISLVIGIVIIAILATIVNGFGFIGGQIGTLFSSLVKPATSRLIQTVAENRQPYFTEWGGSFGPTIKGIPIFFSLFFVGSIYLFGQIFKELKGKWILMFAYLIFLSAIVFSRYAGDSVLNGENGISLFIYLGGILFFVGTLIYYYIKLYQEKGLGKLKLVSFGNIMILAFFVLSVVSARGLVRLIMILVPSGSAVVAYFVVAISKGALEKRGGKEDILKLLSWFAVGIIIIATFYSGFIYYGVSKNQASQFQPSQYNWQWQLAMDWVRNNTSEDAVFGHWWDYGYWVQSLGERATVLDGGNSISYWNHLMGRHVLTTPDDQTALEFLYAHKTTHYLIDSTEIGKYGAYSKIGSDAEYDRITYIPTIVVNEKESKETSDGIIYLYNGGFGIDEDLLIELEGEEKRFIQENTGVAAILIEEKNGELQQPTAVLIQNGATTNVKMRYLYDGGKLTDFGSGIDAGIFLMDYLTPSGNNLEKVENGAAFYLSGRTVNSFLARKYLFGEEGNFKLVHSEPNYIINSIRSQGVEVEDFAYLQGQFLGPIKIWEIDYPSNMELNEEYLSRDYPEELKFS